MAQVKTIVICGVLLMLLAVILGAFGAHALSDLLERNDRLETFSTASQYHFYHALGLLIIGILMQSFESLKYKRMIFIFMLSGTVIFCGALYILAIFNITWLGAIAPIGALLMLLSWGMLIVALCKLQ